MNRSNSYLYRWCLAVVFTLSVTPLAAQTDKIVLISTATQLSLFAPDNTTDTTPTISGTTDAAAQTTVMLYVFDSNSNGHFLSTTVQTDGSFAAEVEEALPLGAYQVCAMIELNNTEVPEIKHLPLQRADNVLGCPWSNNEPDRLVANDAGSIVAAPTTQARSVPAVGLPALLLMGILLMALVQHRFMRLGLSNR